MSNEQRIAMLEALLDRVRARAAERLRAFDASLGVGADPPAAGAGDVRGALDAVMDAAPAFVPSTLNNLGPYATQARAHTQAIAEAEAQARAEAEARAQTHAPTKPHVPAIPPEATRTLIDPPRVDFSKTLVDPVRPAFLAPPETGQLDPRKTIDGPPPAPRPAPPRPLPPRPFAPAIAAAPPPPPADVAVPPPAPVAPSPLDAPPADTDYDLAPAVTELRESRQRLITAKPSLDDEAPMIEEISVSTVDADEAEQIAEGESEYLSEGELELADEVPARHDDVPVARVDADGREHERERDEEDEEEPAPSSSRRPTGPEPVEQLEKEIFATPEEVPVPPPRHTPPPDSGKLPKASEHPPAIDDFDVGDVTGVHAAPLEKRDASARPEPMMEPMMDQTAEREAAMDPVIESATEYDDDTRSLERSGEHRAHESSRVDLSPEVTRAALAPSNRVAEVVGAARRFSPQTFGELLDATLSL